MTQHQNGTTENANAPGRGALSQVKQKHPLHILCIDDDENIREFLGTCLKRFNHQVMVATGGKHGMELFHNALLENQPYEVVITDLGMPDMDGHDVARTIRAESPNTPIIMMTGWGASLEDDAATASEVDALVNKPPCMQELNDLILRITALAQARRYTVANPALPRLAV
jgi:DNA-binding response OmpR family regulator